MKNRNIPYYVAALMLAVGVSTSFVSCVDTDEPETVTKLRQEAIAKLQADADFVKAQAELQRAKAANETAQAKFQDQKTLTEAATTKAAELKNKVAEDTLSAATARAIAIANQEAQAAIETMKQATQTYELAAADYARALKAAQKASEETAATLGFDKNGQDIVASYFSAYVDAQKATLQAQVDYNQAVADAVTGTKIHHDAEYDDKGGLIKAAWDEEVKGTVDFENEVKTKEVALANAQAALAEVTKKFASLDVENWQKEYDAAETSLVKVKKELAQLEEKVEVKTEAVDLKKKAISNEYDAWKATTATYSFGEDDGVTAALVDELFGEGKKESPKYGTNENTLVRYSSSKLTVFFAEEKKDKDGNTVHDPETGEVVLEDFDSQIQNGSAADALVNFANELAKRYSDEFKANSLRDAKTDAEKAYNEAYKSIYGAGKKDNDAADNDNYKGLMKLYQDAYKAYTDKKADKNATETEISNAKKDYEDAAKNLYGRTTSYVKEGTGSEILGAEVSEPTVIKNNEEAKKNVWGAFGDYVAAKKAKTDATAEYNNFGNGKTLYKAVLGKQKAAADAADAASEANDEKLASDADLLALQKELSEAKRDYDTKDIEKQQYEAVKNAISKSVTSIIGLKDENDKEVEIDFGKLESEKKNALAGLEKAVAKAQAEKDAADAALKAHNDGLSDAKINVDYKKKLWDIAKDKEATKKAEYEAVKKVYEAKAE
jgi:hypothetical protein